VEREKAACFGVKSPLSSEERGLETKGGDVFVFQVPGNGYKGKQQWQRGGISNGYDVSATVVVVAKGLAFLTPSYQ